VIAAERVERDPHGRATFIASLTRFWIDGFHDDCVAALVETALPTNAVRQHGFVAADAVLELDRRLMVVTAPVALFGVGGASLRYCHDGSRVPTGFE